MPVSFVIVQRKHHANGRGYAGLIQALAQQRRCRGVCAETSTSKTLEGAIDGRSGGWNSEQAGLAVLLMKSSLSEGRALTRSLVKETVAV